MHDVELEAAGSADVRAGLRVSTLSIAWTIASSAAAVAVGVAADSLVLVAFGVVGALDAAGSATLVLHFRHALRHQAVSERHERVALRTVTIGLMVVGLATAGRAAVESFWGCTERRSRPASRSRDVGIRAGRPVAAEAAHRVCDTQPGVVGRRLVVGRGALLAIVTLAGTGLSALFGWWWVDPVAAGLVGIGAAVAGIVLFRD